MEAHLETALDLLYDSIQQIAAFMTGIFSIKKQLDDRYIYQDLTSSLYYAGQFADHGKFYDVIDCLTRVKLLIEHITSS